MSNYRRLRFPGGYFFFTLVTQERRRFLTSSFARDNLKRAMHIVNQTRPFETIALCLLPDHFHCIWKLPDGDSDYSQRWRSIKSIFTREYRKVHLTSDDNIERIWQNRFWERLIRDEDDLSAHIDYIHYNPVKHKYVDNPVEWEFSTIHKFIKRGYYQSFIENNGVKAIIDLPSARE